MAAKAISIPTMRDICKIGGGVDQCKYLGKEVKNFVCLKNTEFEKTITLLSKQNQDNKDIAGHPTGDNCDGFGKTSASLLED